MIFFEQTMKEAFWTVTFVALIACCCWGCRNAPSPASDLGDTGDPPIDVREPCTEHNPLRNAYFGDLHIHTALSFDAWIWDLRTTPQDAYDFAKGEPITLPPLDENGEGTRTIRLERPLDFAVVTDHAEYLAEVQACTTEASPAYDTLDCLIFRQGNFLSTVIIAIQLSSVEPKRSRDICGPKGADCPALAESVWKRIQEAAEDAYDRSSECSFTTFVGYEYTGAPRISNMHRNVIFRNHKVPVRPISYIEQPALPGFWEELKRACLEDTNGCDVLAIPHNSNESSGNAFYVEAPGTGGLEEQRALASMRAEMEPLVEIFQHKGDSECRNGMYGITGQPDELCNFEKLRKPDAPDCMDGWGIGGQMRVGCVSRFNFIRFVLLEGLKEEERIGVNPYRLGIIASTDTHNASPGSVVEDGFVGHSATEDDTLEKRLAPDQVIHNPGGLAGVWAEENARDAIFDALKRRETFGTSGPRMVVRFFGGWGYPGTLCSSSDFVKIGYETGVPMGGDLPAQPEGKSAPTFAVWAMREPDLGSRRGTPLQWIQIVKG